MCSGSGDPRPGADGLSVAVAVRPGFGGSLSGRYNSAACRLVGDYAAVGLSRRPGSGQLVVGTGPLSWTGCMTGTLPGRPEGPLPQVGPGR